MEDRKNENPYPKQIHPFSAKPSYVAPDLNLDKMRQEANRNNNPPYNKSIENLGGGPLKGEK